jgi:hypothetical protein
MTNQILALADRIEQAKELPIVVSLKAVKELRRLHEVNVELLAALTWYVENDDCSIGQDGNEFWEDGLNKAKAAIEKATGETE